MKHHTHYVTKTRVKTVHIGVRFLLCCNLVIFNLSDNPQQVPIKEPKRHPHWDYDDDDDEWTYTRKRKRHSQKQKHPMFIFKY